MRRKDLIWLPLILALPGIILAIKDLVILTGLEYSRPGSGEGGFILFYWNLFLLPTHFVLLIPSWFLLRMSESKNLAVRIKIFLDLLTLAVVFPIFFVLINSVGHGKFGHILGGFLPVLIVILVVSGFILVGWIPIFKKFNIRL